jgi:hypothetical protein
METNVVALGSHMDQPNPLHQARNSGNLIPVTSCRGTLAQPDERSLEENRILMASRVKKRVTSAMLIMRSCISVILYGPLVCQR